MEEITKTETTEPQVETAENVKVDRRRFNKGGARKGAGRMAFSEADKKIPTGIRLPQDVYAFLQMQPNKSVFIENLIREHCKNNNIPLN